MAYLVLACLIWLWYALLPLRWQTSRMSGPDAALRRASGAAVRGRWEPVARLFEDTGRDWERRSHYARHFGHLAAQRNDRWLTAWEEARPEDPDSASVRAQARIAHAWKLRGARYAEHTSASQFDGFHRELQTSRHDIDRAARLCPDDPSPYAAEIWRALGLGYGNREMRALWSEVTTRAPHHMGAHLAALQYWTAKWRGSETLVREFAEKAAAEGPPGSLLATLPLFAWYENHSGERDEAEFGSARVRVMVDAALRDVALADPGHPQLPYVRHLLGYFLHRQGRYAEAGKQFREVDGFTNGVPWRYYPLPRLYYRVVRTSAARKAFFGRLARRHL
jgi:hypothetical protein